MSTAPSLPVNRGRISASHPTGGTVSVAPGTALVRWTPGSDSGLKPEVGVKATFTALALNRNQNIGVQSTMGQLQLSRDQNIGVEARMALFWQSVVTMQDNNSNSHVINKPAGTVDGDLLIALWGNSSLVGNDNPISTLSGWNLIKTTTQTGATNVAYAKSYWRIASSEPASYTWASPVPQGVTTGEIHRIAGTDPTTPVNASNDGKVLATALVTNPVNVSVTTTVANCLVLAWLFHDHGALSNTHTAPTSHVEVTDFQGGTVTLDGSTTDWRVFSAAAATGTATHTCTETVPTDALYQRIAIAPGVLILA